MTREAVSVWELAWCSGDRDRLISVPALKHADPAFAALKVFAVGSYATLLPPVIKNEESALQAACRLPTDEEGSGLESVVSSPSRR